MKLGLVQTHSNYASHPHSGLPLPLRPGLLRNRRYRHKREINRLAARVLRRLRPIHPPNRIIVVPSRELIAQAPVRQLRKVLRRVRVRGIIRGVVLASLQVQRAVRKDVHVDLASGVPHARVEQRHAHVGPVAGRQGQRRGRVRDGAVRVREGKVPDEQALCAVGLCCVQIIVLVAVGCVDFACPVAEAFDRSACVA